MKNCLDVLDRYLSLYLLNTRIIMPLRLGAVKCVELPVRLGIGGGREGSADLAVAEKI